MRVRAIVVASGLALAVMTPAAYAKCSADAVQVGQVCVDKYEASVWIVPNPTGSNKGLVKAIQKGSATQAKLTAAGASQVPTSFLMSCVPGFPPNFPADGNWTPVPASDPPTPGVYAVSLPGVMPNTCLSWFQAEQACLLAGKRLLTNSEWQGAASGTPDPGTDDLTSDCAVMSPMPVTTGSRSSCKSNFGVFDMVGNVDELVADWVDQNNVGCTDWTSQTGIAGTDFSCFSGNGSSVGARIPGELVRGGMWLLGPSAGVFAVNSGKRPSDQDGSIGFRCGRNTK